MKSLHLAFAAITLALAGCDLGTADAPSPGEVEQKSATPKPGGEQATPKPRDWMWKNYKNPLDQRPQQPVSR